MNARQRIECAFPAYLLYNICRSIYEVVPDDEKAQYMHKAALDAAVVQPFAGLPDKDAASQRRRLIRLYGDTVDAHYAGKNLSGMALLAYHFMEWLQENALEIGEDSTLRDVADGLFAEVNLQHEGFTALAKSAEKQAPKLIQALQERGYYT